MDRNIFVVSSLALALLLPISAHATDTSHVVISQLQVAGTTATDEWIELYNPTASVIDLSSYSLQYKSATGSTFQKKNFSTGASIAAHGYYLVSHTDSVVVSSADMAHSSFSMSGTGGNVYLVNTQTTLPSSTDGSIVDHIGYGNGNAPEGTAAAAPASNQSIERKPGGTEGNGIDTNNNAADLVVKSSPSPRSSHSPIQPSSLTPVAPTTPAPPPTSSDTSSSSQSSTTTNSSSSSASSPSTATTPSSSNDSSSTNTSSTSTATTPTPSTVRLNEILPHPSANEKEWIELFFSGNPFSLTGWTIEDGKGVIATLDATPTSAFFIVELALAKLNNDGDAVILKKSNGTVVDRVTYGSFDDGNKNDNAAVPTESMTLNRFPDGKDSDSDVIDWFVSKQATKGSLNTVIAPPTSTSQTTTLAPRANTPDPNDPLPLVFINEFVSAPADGDTEWVELVNLETHTMFVNGWTLEDGSGALTILSGRIGTADSNRYLIIPSPNGGLNNNGDTIILRDTTRRQIDRVAYGDFASTPTANAPVARDPASVARIVDGYTSGKLPKDFVVTTTPTQGKRNVITMAPTTAVSVHEATTPKPATTPKTTSANTDGEILMNEVFPNPLGEDRGNEWLELITRSETPLTISSLVIDVRNGARRTLPSITLDRNTPLLLKASQLPPFPNAGATVRLLTEQHDAKGRVTEKELDRISFPAALSEGLSYAMSTDGRWDWSTTPTPGLTNINSAPNQAPMAVFGAPKTASEGNVILFDASDSFDPENQPLTYAWSFSDGSTATGVAVEKKLPNAKRLTATLVVSDGLATATKNDSLTIQSSKPENARASVSSATVPPSSHTRTPVVALERVLLSDIKNLERNTKVITQGVVSAPIGTFPNDAFALAGSGIIVILSGRQQWPKIAVGDIVQIAGAVSVSQTGPALRVTRANQITVLGHGPAPAPLAVSISDALEREDNDLITITGTLRDVRAKSWLVEDHDNEIVVMPPTGLERTATEGEAVTLTGIIEHTKTSNRLRMRFPQDAQFQTPAPATETTTLPTHEQSKLPLMAFASILAVSALALVIYTPGSIRPGFGASAIQTLPETMVRQDGNLQISTSFQSEENNL